MKKKMGWLVAFAMSVVLANAGTIIMSWSSNGVLKATGMEPGTSYAFEWTSDLQNGFSNGVPDFEGLVADSSGVVEVAVPTSLLSSGPVSMFFRASETATNTVPKDLEAMVLVPAGTNAGTNPLADAEYYDLEYPETYSLTVEAFYMDATEVTKAQWDTVHTWAVAHGYGFENAGSGKAPNHPVHTVNWFDCVKWCNARSEMQGRTPCYTLGGVTYRTGQPLSIIYPSPVCNTSANGYRLPTSDEWEYAARGGLSSKRFPWGDTITHSQANYYSNSEGTPLYSSYDISPTRGSHPDYNGNDEALMPYTSPVGAFAANAYGLYDMEGNVWEWCNMGSGFLPIAIRRGGSWYGFARCGLELEEDQYSVHDGAGFRSVSR